MHGHLASAPRTVVGRGHCGSRRSLCPDHDFVCHLFQCSGPHQIKSSPVFLVLQSQLQKSEYSSKLRNTELQVGAPCGKVWHGKVWCYVCVLTFFYTYSILDLATSIGDTVFVELLLFHGYLHVFCEDSQGILLVLVTDSIHYTLTSSFTVITYISPWTDKLNV